MSTLYLPAQYAKPAPVARRLRPGGSIDRHRVRDYAGLLRFLLKRFSRFESPHRAGLLHRLLVLLAVVSLNQ